ncbi:MULTISPECIES: VanZ family protein [unclassified Amycolatopsis]|uniref:VanZ family protein n=1 Tax=unclassified Amycolatopsis TaxID=2618356 RepID=UPI002874FEBD|nr:MULTISPECIES: VanZ family protein [unclassified Amycolatopsis]MDS0133943.1 VanZ family protein [Amycolatopsis sp. 505]MDS0144819.1 VanZ family protein [Amycolatopsis sp. CM201R]
MGALLRAFWGMIPISAIALPYALLGWPLLAARRRRRMAARRASATAAVDCAVFLVVFLVFCLVTMPVGGSGESTLDLVPGADIAAAFSSDGSLWQVIGNVLLLGPLGALLPLRIRRLRALLRIALAALIASVLVEGTQYLIHTGRVTSADDVLLNTAGATLGAALSRRGWRALDAAPPVPVAIPRPRRTICPAPTLTLRVPRSVWDTRYAAIAHPERQ